MPDGDVVADPLPIAHAQLPADALSAAGSELPLERGDKTRIDLAHADEFRGRARSELEVTAIGMLTT